MATFRTLSLSISDDAKAATAKRRRHFKRSSVNLRPFHTSKNKKKKRSSLMFDSLLLSTFLCLPQNSGEAFVLSW